MLVKDPLCAMETAYQALELPTDVEPGAITDAYRRLVMSLGPAKAKATQHRRNLSVAETRMIEDVRCHVEMGAEGELDLEEERRETALEGLLEHLRGWPGNWRVMHQAAVLSLWWAVELGRRQSQETDLLKAWDRVAGLWSPLFQNEAFWLDWADRRSQAYGRPAREIDLAKVALELRRLIEDDALHSLERLSSFVAQGVQALFVMERGLILDLRNKVHAFIQHQSNAPGGQTSPLVGPYLIHALGREHRLASLGKTLELGRPEKGRVALIRWNNACRHLLTFRLAVHPRLRLMLALLMNHRPLQAVEVGRELMQGEGLDPLDREAVRFLAASAFRRQAILEAAQGEARSHQALDFLEQAHAVFLKAGSGAQALSGDLAAALAQTAEAEAERALDQMQDLALESAKAWEERFDEDGYPSGLGRAVSALRRVHDFVAEADSGKVRGLAQLLAYYHLERFKHHVKARRMEEAERDLGAAQYYDPENPVFKGMM